MALKNQTLRTCKNGHQYYKNTACPTCPICEEEQKPEAGFLSLIAAPARRALQNAGVTTLHQLSKLSEAEILKLHGMGPGTLPKLRNALKASGLGFKE